MSIFSKKKRRNLYRIQNGYCFYCNIYFPIEKTNIDHVIPKSKIKNGLHNNCVVSCIKCNDKKKDRNPTQEELGRVKELYLKFRLWVRYKNAIHNLYRTKD